MRDKTDSVRDPRAARRESSTATSYCSWSCGFVDASLLGEERFELRDDDVTVRIRVDRAPDAHLHGMPAKP